jgi:ABC-type Fe3+-hydroxamate transport system substrate-binding protein
MKLKKKNKIFFVLFLLFSLSPIGFSQPKRIVSLMPSLTESLFQLGVGKYIVGVTSYCNYPAEAKTRTIVGSAMNINSEMIYSLSPDLVLCIRGANRAEMIDRLKSLGLNVVVFEESNNFNDIANNFIALGNLVGKPETAKEIVKMVEMEVNIISRKAKALKPLSVFWEVSANPLFTTGGVTFANELIKLSGGTNIFSDITINYPKISREDVLRKNPDVIFLVTMGDVTENEVTYWQKFSDLNAAKSNRIFIINSDIACRPTPSNFLESLIEVTRKLHPEVLRGLK